MTNRLWAAPVALVLVLGACGGSDKDGDGLTKSEEKELGLDPDIADFDQDGVLDGDEHLIHGTDPKNPDSDGDGLLDGVEIYGDPEHGFVSDPLLEDSDLDGYLDPWEVAEGSDPADDKDRIYKGNWPYNPAKADMKNRSFDGALSVGDSFGRHKGRDQHNDKVDLYDFADGKYVIVDASAGWCGPCRNTSEWLTGGADSYGNEATYGTVRKHVDKGKVHWITVIIQDNDFAIADSDDAAAWDEDYPHKRIPVLTDPDGDIDRAIVGAYGGIPAGVLLGLNSKGDSFEVLAIGHVNDAMAAYMDEAGL